MDENPNENKLWPKIIIFLFLIIFFSVGYFYLKNTQKPTENFIQKTEIPGLISVAGGNFYFNPNEIKVKLGQTVKMEFTSTDSSHDFVIDEFNVKTKMLKNNQTEQFEFTADKKGEFEFYCSIGNHRSMGMRGKLIVE